MGKHIVIIRAKTAGVFLSTILTAFLAAILAFGFTPGSFGAQSAPAQANATPTPTPQWQIDAGGKMEFDVVSIKPNTSGHFPNGPRPYSNIPLGPQDAFSPTGGLLTATNMPLFQYMIFAYKLTPDQTRAAISQMPKWALSANYDIQARATGNPTKDQFRLMMQALLADRFKVAVHFETRQLPVFALVLDKAGKLGPQIQPHPDDAPCTSAPGSAQGLASTGADGFPETCGVIAILKPTAPGRVRVGARGMSLATLASYGDGQFTGVDKPIIDKTGLKGTFDFVVEFTPVFAGPLPPGANFHPDDSGPTFLEALKQQLGFKLEPDKGPVDVIVVDHVEQPSEN